MYRELYENGIPANESQIIAELIERAVLLAAVDVDLTMQYLTDGLLAIVNLRPPHHATWNIQWMHTNSNIIETGMDNPPSLADPLIQDRLTEDMKKIHTYIHTYCRCELCKSSL